MNNLKTKVLTNLIWNNFSTMDHFFGCLFRDDSYFGDVL